MKNSKNTKNTKVVKTYVPRQSKIAAILWTVILIAFTVIVALVDVQAIGPEDGFRPVSFYVEVIDD